MSKEILNVPDELGPLILTQLATANPDYGVGFLLIVVAAGQPIQTVTNLDDSMQVDLLRQTADTVEREGMAVSTLMKPEGEG